jgi:23S rRNA (guanosine2251-2'-O)-methyltransferase
MHAPQKVIRLCLARGFEGGRLQLLHEKAQAAAVPLEWLERKELDMRTKNAVHQGVMAQVSAFSLLSEEALLELVVPCRADRVVLMLDGVEDPQNLGAIARSSLALGVSALVIGKNRSVGLTPAVLKASAGALVHLPVSQVTNLSRLLGRLKKEGYWSLAASPEASTALWAVDAKGPWVVVVGGEGRGIGSNLLRHCDFHVHIPMLGQLSSLNASVSAGIVLYELLRQSRT